jgi:D-alanyl-D-alanine carboxypeptidase (penicillin-binding protein 5/6)
MRLHDLVYASLLNSANDAATVVAEGLGGSEEGFAARMNAKARNVGATTAHFMNPHGLTAPGHVASARDIATIFRYGLGLPMFRDVLSTRTVKVRLEAPGLRWVSLRSHNRLLTGYTYPVIGKTGYTRAAGRCFVGAAEHKGREIIVVLLGASDLWGDARRLLAFGFAPTDDALPADVTVANVPKTERRPSPGAASEGDLEVPGEEPRQEAFQYALQLGPYRSRDAASATRKRLVRRGYKAELVGRRVRVGSYPTRTKARAAARRLLASGYQPTIVALR